MKIKGIIFSTIIVIAGYAVAMVKESETKQTFQPPSLKQAVIRAKAKEIYEKTTTLAAFQKELQKTPEELKKWSLAELGRQYYMLYGIQLDTGAPWGVSIQDYLDSPELKNKMPQIKTNHKGETDLSLNNMKINNLYGLQNIPNIKTVQSLYLGSNKLTTIQSNAFAGLPNLKELNLYNNLLSTIPTKAFAGLTNLKELVLMGNQLTIIPTKAFAGLTNLEELYLNNNLLTTIQSNAFAGLTNLEGLYLRFNRLTAQAQKAIKKALPGVKIDF